MAITPRKQDQIFIKPADGLTVRDPITQRPLAAEGERKLRNAYWLRRLKDGDVVKTKPAAAKKAAAKKEQ